MGAQAARQARLDLLVVEDGIALENVGPRKAMLIERADAAELAISGIARLPGGSRNEATGPSRRYDARER